jgi:hypothetical protein
VNQPREINWRREAIHPAQAMADACLLAPWLMMFLSPVTTPSPESITTTCLVIILGTLYIARTMDKLRVNEWIQRGLILAGILGLSAVAMKVLVLSRPPWSLQGWDDALRHPSLLVNLLPGAIVILLSVVWLFWRGLRMANQPVSVLDAMVGFQIGVVVMSLFAIISPMRATLIFVPVFFFSELLTVGLTRVEAASISSAGRRLPFSGWWLTALTATTALVILVELAITAIVLGIGPDKLIMLIAPVLAIMALPVLLIMAPFMMLLSRIVNALMSMAQPLLTQLQNWGQQVQNWLEGKMASRPPWIDFVLRALGYAFIAVIILAVVSVLVVVILKVGRRLKAKESDKDEEHESVFSTQAILRKLRQQLRRRFGRLRRLTDIAGRFGASGLFTALTIRRIYAQTVKLGATRGYPRPAACTPYEHLATLYQAFPDCDNDLSQITEAYVGVHYGELPEQPDALEHIRAAFERIKATEPIKATDKVTG